jgi:heterodisulfide reductase subunit B
MAKKTYLYFPGCKINRFLPQYGASTRAVLSKLDIILDETELNCCGYPVRHENFAAYMVAAVRNLAMAAAKDLPLMTPCKCCYGNLKHADHWMRNDTGLRDQVNRALADERLEWKDDTTIVHLLNLFDMDIGVKRLNDCISHPLNGIRVAASYGCHALRPGHITQLDNPLSPTLFERLIAATGAVAVDWPLRLECCGRPLWEKNNRFSLDLMNSKIEDARQSGAQILVTACTHCQMQFDDVQAEHADNDKPLLPAVLYTQLLGTAMGLSSNVLGISANQIEWAQKGLRKE